MSMEEVDAELGSKLQESDDCQPSDDNEHSDEDSVLPSTEQVEHQSNYAPALEPGSKARKSSSKASWSSASSAKKSDGDSSDRMRSQIWQTLNKLSQPETPSDKDELWCLALVCSFAGMSEDSKELMKLFVQKTMYDFNHKGVKPSLN